MFAYCLNNPVGFADETGSAARSCLSADGSVDDAPWRDISPSGGGRLYRNYSTSSNYYGAIADKFYTLQVLDALGINELSDFKPISRMGKGVKSISDGVSLLLAPIPTLTDDLIGVYKITKGIINACWGFAEGLGNLYGK